MSMNISSENANRSNPNVPHSDIFASESPKQTLVNSPLATITNIKKSPAFSKDTKDIQKLLDECRIDNCIR